MKNAMKFLFIFLALMLTFSAKLFALPVSVGDDITFSAGYGSGHSVIITGNSSATWVRGGEYNVYASGTAETPENILFKSFCVEMTQYLSFSGTFTVGDITDAVDSGGAGGPSPNDPLDNATKWLYWHYALGDLNTQVGAYSYDNNASANALQDAIWYIEEEITSLSTLAQTLVNAALAADYDNVGEVAVINLLNASGRGAQDILVANLPVPEPATLLLLGVGLVGIGIARKHMKK